MWKDSSPSNWSPPTSQVSPDECHWKVDSEQRTVNSVTDHIKPSSQSIQDLCVWLFWSLSVVWQAWALESLQSVLNASRYMGRMCRPWVQLRFALRSGLMPVQMTTRLCWKCKSKRVSDYQNVCSANRYPYSYGSLTQVQVRNLVPPSCLVQI